MASAEERKAEGMNFKIYRSALWGFLLIASPARAQSAGALSFFQSVNAANPAPTAEYVKDGIVAKFALGTSGLPPSCQPGGNIVVTDIKPATADRMLWNAALAGEIRNAWTAKVRLGGCGNQPANYLIVKGKNGQTSLGVLSWGESLAGISLSRDAMLPAISAMASNMKSIDKNCSLEEMKKFKIGPRELYDMKDVGEDVYGVRFKGNWSEIWHFLVCGHDVSVPLKFRADGTGGAYFEAGSGVTAKGL